MLFAILAIICTLVIVVGLHEAGHAVAAKIFKVKIKSITIGFGRALLQWEMNSGTVLIWALWPLGGSVRLLNSRIETVATNRHCLCFDKKPAWVRICILLAGVLANMVFAWCALLLTSNIGLKHRPPIIQKVVAPSVAYDAGLKAGDQLVSLNGTALHSWQEVGRALILAIGSSNALLLTKSNEGIQRHFIDVKNWRAQPSDSSLLQSLGIIPDTNVAPVLIKSSTFFASVQQASTALVDAVVFFCVLLVRIISGSIPFSLLLGPLAAVELMAASLSQGIMVFLWFAAQLSIAVAVINILPIPNLDGGGIVYTLVEKWRGKPVSIALEVLLYRLSIIVLAVLFFNLATNDLQRFLSA